MSILAIDIVYYTILANEVVIMTPKELLDSCASILDAKAQDYTTDMKVDRFENFTRAAVVGSWFADDRDKVYATLITVKLARLASLLGREKTPNNESILDTFKDLVNYSALWGSNRIK